MNHVEQIPLDGLLIHFFDFPGHADFRFANCQSLEFDGAKRSRNKKPFNQKKYRSRISFSGPNGAVRLGQEQLFVPMRLRRLRFRFAIALPMLGFLLGLSGRSSTAPPAAAAAGQFPAIQATSLDGARLNLPANFSGQMNLVIISFAREQQHQVDSWIPAARQIQSAHSKFRYYELPTMSRENLLYRWWFNEALRSNTTAKDLRSRILTAYVGKRGFKKSLHIANEKRVVAVLVDQKGQVYWRADGPFTAQELPAISAVLAANGL